MFDLEVNGEIMDRKSPVYHDLSPALRQFAAYMVRETDRMFQEAGTPGSALSGSSEVRGVRWESVGKKYRKRPSGARITPLSALLQDTGTLRRLAATEITRITPTSLSMGTRLPYAEYQNSTRPFLFMTDADADKLTNMVNAQYEAQERSPGNKKSPSGSGDRG